MKTLTTPRLELCAATIAVRLDEKLRAELNFPCPLKPSTFWTDSASVLRYINNESSVFHTFVANRVQLIRDLSQPEQWRYVPTQENPADNASRGLTIQALAQEQRWQSGPKFLWQSKLFWPDQPVLTKRDAINDSEIKEICVSCVASTSSNQHILDKLLTKYSNCLKLLRVCARTIYFKKLFLHLLNKGETHHEKPFIMLNVQDIYEAENLILGHLQACAYPEEILCLKQDNPLKGSSSLYKLNPFLEDGLLRVGGRIEHAPLPYEMKHPVLIPNNHPVASLIIEDIHCKLGHADQQHVLSELRSKYWVVRVNSTVRKVLANCTHCRKRFSRPLQQKMAHFPEQRLDSTKPPFSYVGVDYFGPFFTRRGRAKVKKYGVVFTCLTIRAVHIEIASNFDTSSFIQALRRFLARRGPVIQIKSDNGTNFVGGERELKALENWNREQIHDFLLQRRIDWSFNPPGVSHFGGVWERLIRSIRKILKGLCNEQVLTDESLNTLMCEVENIINSRPITCCSDDPSDLESLTPNHFLQLKPPCALPPGTFFQHDLSSRKHWRQVQYLTNVFWSRWIKEYVPLLQARQKWNKVNTNLSIGDIVLIVDSSLPRNAWLIGCVVETYPDSKGLVRSVRVRTKHSIIVRPITKLYLIVSNEM